MILRGKRLTLRPFTADDIEPTLAILSEPAVARWWGRYDEAKARDEFLDDPRLEVLAIEVGGELAGLIQVFEESEPDYMHAAIDIGIATAHQNKGLGREAIRLVIDHLARERGHHRFTIDPHPDNARAIACYSAVGFKPVGVMREYERETTGEWEDSLLMDLLARELPPA